MCKKELIQKKAVRNIFNPGNRTIRKQQKDLKHGV